MHKKGKNKEFWPIQVQYEVLKTRNLEKPQLQWADYISVRQYVICDPPTVVYESHETLNTVIPSVVFQQQTKKPWLQRYNNLHIFHKTF